MISLLTFGLLISRLLASGLLATSLPDPQALPPAAWPAALPRVMSAAPPPSRPPLQPLSDRDRAAARIAWKYFEHNWNPHTGLVNSVDALTWTTLWDQGSALLGIHAAHQLGLITAPRLQTRLQTLLNTLETLPLPATGLPNKAYDTATGAMQQLNMRPDPQGRSGWSALDLARFLLGLHVIRTHYPAFRPQIERIVARWPINKLEQDGWLFGTISQKNGTLQRVQEGRFGYEQYAAASLQHWQIQADKAINQPPLTAIAVDGITFQIDQRQMFNSGASNYLTNDPYVLWAMELGLPAALTTQVENLLTVQAQRFQRTGVVTAVNEDSLDRAPYFLYYSVHANGQNWVPVSSRGKAYPHLRFLSTKAAFAWQALRPDHAYSAILRQAVDTLRDPDRGYFSGRYENPALGTNTVLTVNTNAIILESLLYQANGHRPLAD